MVEIPMGWSDWEPTPALRWNADVLQQSFVRRETIQSSRGDYWKDEFEWRDVPHHHG